MSRNPRHAQWLSDDMRSTLDTLSRLDRDGYLYTMDCLWDYRSPLADALLKAYGLGEAGCSVFIARDPAGSTLTCRNYDYCHRMHNDPDGEPTGLNVVVHCAPKNGFRSVGVADAFWLDKQNAGFTRGVLDDGVTDISPAAMLPFCCMDGLNEKGLTVSILSQPIRPGEVCVCQKTEGLPKVTYTVFMRNILDRCENVSQTVAYAKSIAMQSPNGADYRIFVTDAEGHSAALEWRYDRLFVIDTDLCTNFYTGFDDGEDRHGADGTVTEKCVRLYGTTRPYHFGFGGGYQRFTVLAGQLEGCYEQHTGSPIARMTRDRAAAALSSVLRSAEHESTSLTQYSVIYDAARLEGYLRVLPAYDRVYSLHL